MQILKWGFKKKCKIWIVSPTYNQAVKFYKDIANPLLKSGLTKRTLQSQGDILIELINGTVIEFKSAAAKDALRGTTLEYLVLDEADFIDEEIFNKILLPMIITKPKAKVLLLSTPRGKRLMYKYFHTQSPKHYSIKITYRDNPYIDMDIINEFRKNMVPEMFNQEFEAKFVDSAAVFPNIEELCILKSKPDYKGKVWFGIDIGMLNDNTVITAINENDEVIWQDAFTNLESPALKKRIIKAFEQFDVVKGYIEKNNQGLPIYQDLKPILRNKIDGFDTTQKSKPEIINQLIAIFSKKELTLINDEELKRELESFIFKFSKTGKVQFEASTGHDDRVMSLAIAWECKCKHKNISPAIQF